MTFKKTAYFFLFATLFVPLNAFCAPSPETQEAASKLVKEVNGDLVVRGLIDALVRFIPEGEEPTFLRFPFATGFLLGFEELNSSIVAAQTLYEVLERRSIDIQNPFFKLSRGIVEGFTYHKAAREFNKRTLLFYEEDYENIEQAYIHGMQKAAACGDLSVLENSAMFLRVVADDEFELLRGITEAHMVSSNV